MATTNVINGTSLVIYIDGNAVGHAQNHSLTIGNALRDITTKDSAGWAEKLGGLKSWSCSGDGLLALDDTYNPTDLTTLLIAGTQVTIRFTTNTTGDEYWTGNAIMESIDFTSPTEDNVSYSFAISGDGALTNPQFT